MLILWGLTACSMLGLGSDLKSDLQRVCALATELDQAGGLPADKQVARLGKRIAGAKIGPQGRALWKAIEAAPPKARQEVLDRMLTEAGVGGLDCPALRSVLAVE